MRSSARVLFAIVFAGAAASNALALECGDVLGPHGVFILDKDLECDTTPAQPALTLLSGVRLDMRNHSITCRDADVAAFGVRLDGRAAAVRNGQIRGCDFGVDLVGTGKHVVTGLNLVECNDNSVQISSDGNFVADNVVIGGDWAFAVLGGRNVIVRNRSLRSNGDGFFVGGDGNRVFDNAAIFSVCSNFTIRGSGNDLKRNVGAGTLLAVCNGFDVAGRGNRLQRNAATGSAASGIRVDGDANRISGNASTDNAAAGIRLSTTAQENSVRRNDAFGNATFDLQDDNPACDHNDWINNRFATSSASCID